MTVTVLLESNEDLMTAGQPVAGVTLYCVALGTERTKATTKGPAVMQAIQTMAGVELKVMMRTATSTTIRAVTRTTMRAVTKAMTTLAMKVAMKVATMVPMMVPTKLAMETME